MDIELRDYLAGKAMSIVMAETQEVVPATWLDFVKECLRTYVGLTFLVVQYRTVDNVYEDAAERSYRYADAMIEAKKRSQL